MAEGIKNFEPCDKADFNADGAERDLDDSSVTDEVGVGHWR